MSHPICPKCQRRLSADFLKCPYCGENLESLYEPAFDKKICPKCGNETAPDDTFCMVCGAPLKPAEETTAVPAEEPAKKPEHVPELVLDSNPFVLLELEKEKLDVKRKCPKCGKEAEEGDVFCIRCGTRIDQ